MTGVKINKTITGGDLNVEIQHNKQGAPEKQILIENPWTGVKVNKTISESGVSVSVQRVGQEVSSSNVAIQNPWVAVNVSKAIAGPSVNVSVQQSGKIQHSGHQAALEISRTVPGTNVSVNVERIAQGYVSKQIVVQNPFTGVTVNKSISSSAVNISVQRDIGKPSNGQVIVDNLQTGLGAAGNVNVEVQRNMEEAPSGGITVQNSLAGVTVNKSLSGSSVNVSIQRDLPGFATSKRIEVYNPWTGTSINKTIGGEGVNISVQHGLGGAPNSQVIVENPWAGVKINKTVTPNNINVEVQRSVEGTFNSRIVAENPFSTVAVNKTVSPGSGADISIKQGEGASLKKQIVIQNPWTGVTVNKTITGNSVDIQVGRGVQTASEPGVIQDSGKGSSPNKTANENNSNAAQGAGRIISHTLVEIPWTGVSVNKTISTSGVNVEVQRGAQGIPSSQIVIQNPWTGIEVNRTVTGRAVNLQVHGGAQGDVNRLVTAQSHFKGATVDTGDGVSVEAMGGTLGQPNIQVSVQNPWTGMTFNKTVIGTHSNVSVQLGAQSSGSQASNVQHQIFIQNPFTTVTVNRTATGRSVQVEVNRNNQQAFNKQVTITQNPATGITINKTITGNNVNVAVQHGSRANNVRFVTSNILANAGHPIIHIKPVVRRPHHHHVKKVEVADPRASNHLIPQQQFLPFFHARRNPSLPMPPYAHPYIPFMRGNHFEKTRHFWHGFRLVRPARYGAPQVIPNIAIDTQGTGFVVSHTEIYQNGRPLVKNRISANQDFTVITRVHRFSADVLSINYTFNSREAGAAGRGEVANNDVRSELRGFGNTREWFKPNIDVDSGGDDGVSVNTQVYQYGRPASNFVVDNRAGFVLITAVHKLQSKPLSIKYTFLPLGTR
ncbi:uncharacterized protein LOC119396430 isoform X1 [Rhipicephalus sanguineus]|uniref:uncharacterized protein LOC119396430 isoform X1 n=1 Tax=Rhipicephalus sanguineus TaxID=34632 RepID=UPI0020C5944C|nr:uncharacterized protein LOC119396430 isoform X1 [Rhipicephalus sanguineus]